MKTNWQLIRHLLMCEMLDGMQPAHKLLQPAGYQRPIKWCVDTGVHPMDELWFHFPGSFKEMLKRVGRMLKVDPGPWEMERTGGAFVEQVIRPTGLIDPVCIVRPAENQVDDLLYESRQCAEKSQRVLVTTLTTVRLPRAVASTGAFRVSSTIVTRSSSVTPSRRLVLDDSHRALGYGKTASDVGSITSASSLT